MISRTALVSVLAGILSGSVAFAADPLRLTERFDPLNSYRVDLRVDITGELTVPGESGKSPQRLTLTGSSRLTYDERPLAYDGNSDRAIRVYRDILIRRTVAGRDQEADIRPGVRRMVVLRSAEGKKAPFSPDGPLTWSEIDVVRTDVFSPALVPGLLPTTPVRPGDSWQLTPVAVAELTDLDPIKIGTLTATYITTISLEGRRYAKLTLTGTVTGVGQDGPGRHKLDGLAYFDLDAERLTYLNLRGTHELLGPDGKVQGRIDGKFVLNRQAAGRVAELSETVLRDTDLQPTADNTHLLYENPDLGVRFLYPRRWRVVAARGRQLTIEEPKGGGILLTLEPTNKLPTADQYLAETREYLRTQKWAVSAIDPPRAWTDRIQRFALNADVEDRPVRMEYAVYTGPEGGAVVAARLPWGDREELRADLDRILKSLSLSKPMK